MIPGLSTTVDFASDSPMSPDQWRLTFGIGGKYPKQHAATFFLFADSVEILDAVGKNARVTYTPREVVKPKS